MSAVQQVDVVALSVADVKARRNDAMAIYVAAMGYTESAGVQRGVHLERHAEYDQFAARAAITPDGRMVGFGYGYTSLPGQWWHDLVRRAIGRHKSSVWLRNAFELSELHVLPEVQGHGIGERMLRSLVSDLPHETVVLSTPEGENRAWRLYRRLGFEDLARDHTFPGDHRPFAVLGARLPFTG